MTGVSGPSSAIDRGAIAMGATAIVFSSFVFGAMLPTEFRFVNIGPMGASVLVTAGVLAIVSGIIRRGLLRLIAGTLLTGAALFQLVGLALSVRPLGGDASAMAVAGGLGIGLLALAFSTSPPAQPHEPTKGRP